MLVAWAAPWLAVGAESPDATAPGEPATWKLETLTLRDGTVYAGLILSARETEVEFAEIVRPPGQPMYVLIRPIVPAQIAKTERLEGDERARLVERFQRFRNRSLIEAGRMEAVALTPATVGDRAAWICEGPWFRLESTADEGMTRRCVVRVEQIFRAYRQLLPPTTERRSDLQLRLFGAMDEYFGFVREAGFAIDTPAFFSAEKNLVVAGSELNSYARRLDQVRRQNADVRRQYKSLKASFTDRLAVVIDDMKRRGYSEAEIEQEAKLRGAVWQREYDEAMLRLDQVEKRNEARFAEVTQQMFPRLYHEAFHAYVANYAYAERGRGLPHWLDEGWAQIFESGQLEADTLRVDAPDRSRLTRLQGDLSAGQPLPLAQVLAADERGFLQGQGDEAGRRLYLYSWGLTHYLTFEMNLLDPQVLTPYVLNAGDYGPPARFTRLVGMPLDKFERQWRRAMLNLGAREPP